MNRFIIEFDEKEYNAVEIDGECISDDDFTFDTIILAESALNEDIMRYMDECDEYNDMYSRAIEIDENIFGFGNNELICNGTDEELRKYAHSLL